MHWASTYASAPVIGIQDVEVNKTEKKTLLLSALYSTEEEKQWANLINTVGKIEQGKRGMGVQGWGVEFSFSGDGQESKMMTLNKHFHEEGVTHENIFPNLHNIRNFPIDSGLESMQLVSISIHILSTCFFIHLFNKYLSTT